MGDKQCNVGLQLLLSVDKRSPGAAGSIIHFTNLPTHNVVCTTKAIVANGSRVSLDDTTDTCTGCISDHTANQSAFVPPVACTSTQSCAELVLFLTLTLISGNPKEVALTQNLKMR